MWIYRILPFLFAIVTLIVACSADFSPENGDPLSSSIPKNQSSSRLSSSSSLESDPGDPLQDTCPNSYRDSTFTDCRDNQVYKMDTIGEQIWMMENLRFKPLQGESWCYGDDEKSCMEYGRLYSWDATVYSCPFGWHLPDTTEWTKLRFDETFSGSPGGYVFGAQYQYINEVSYWWTAMEDKDGYAYYEYLQKGKSLVQDRHFKSNGMSVRCVRDSVDEFQTGISSSSGLVSVENSATSSATCQALTKPNCDLSQGSSFGVMTDARDGQSYKTVKMCSYTWMAENLNYSGDDGAGGRRYDVGACYGVGEDNMDNVDTAQHQDAETCLNGYGRLYFWTDAMGVDRSYMNKLAGDLVVYPHQGICPSGWHIPDTTEWYNLLQYVYWNKVKQYPKISESGEFVCFSEEAAYLKAFPITIEDSMSQEQWNDTSFNEGDPYGFHALPAGKYDDYWGWGARGSVAGYWLSTEVAYQGTVFSVTANIQWLRYAVTVGIDRNEALSIRCIQDN